MSGTHAIVRRSRADYSAAEPIDFDLPFSEDTRCQEIVASHPDGMTHEHIGLYMGVCRERVRQIEARALRSLVLRCELAGISREDVVAVLSAKPSDDLPDVSAGITVTRPRRNVGATHWSVQPLPVEPYSEHGQRVEAAVAELDAMIDRMEGR